MSLKCKLGFHDWEQITCKSHSEIETIVQREMTEDKYHLGIERFPDTYYEDKVCLRCSKHVDEITPHKEFIYAEILAKKARIRKRKALLKSIVNKPSIIA